MWRNREEGIMPVLVTGGAGFIGSHTAKALAHAGLEPVVIDDLSNGRRTAMRWGPFVYGDVGNRNLLRQVMGEYHIEGVIHFAAHAYVGESVYEPRKYFQNNVENTLTLLDAMMDAGVERIVFSSTCATYGLPESLPIGEDHPQRPVNPYGESKLFIERVLHAYGHAYGLRWVTLRYFNAAGADPDGELGEDHDPETHLIPLVIQAALGRRPSIEVFGTDYPTPDGTAIRDFIHVTDLADAHVRALRHLSDGHDSMALNLGTGAGHSVREVIATVERVSRHSVPVREAPRRPGDPPALVADARRAQSVLGWQPRFADLDVIVRTAWDWQANILAGKRHPVERPEVMVMGSR
jgi:UDP-arabinose 4-epimerase